MKNLNEQPAFEMPSNRLLNAAEAKLLENNNISFSWIKCKHCGVLGATTDERELCSDNCLSEFTNEKVPYSPRSEFAKKGDYVKFNDKPALVMEVHSKLKEVKKSESKNYFYVLCQEGNVFIEKECNAKLLRI